MAYALQHRHSGQVATASGLDILAGIWLLISPFVLAFTLVAPRSNNVICGIVVTILAAIRFFGARDAAWLSWINALIGLWVLIAPWALGFSRTGTATTNNVLIGIAIIILAVWSALATSSGQSEERPMP
jgi:hypothetical protein